MSAAAGYLSKQSPVQLALAAGLILGVVYFLGRKTLSDVASGVGGVASGNNALTEGTAYAGKGVAGTLGAAVNTASGGIFERFGSWIGGQIADATDDYDPNAPIKHVGASKTSTYDKPLYYPED